MKSMRLNKRVQKGFTLIELMIVVAIVGILAAIALPAYNNYMIKSKLTEATATLDAAKVAVVEAYTSQGGGNFSASSPIAPLSKSAKYISSVNYYPNGSNVGITVGLQKTGNSSVDGNYIGIFGTAATDGTVQWTCGTAGSASAVTAPQNTSSMFAYLPAACQN